MHTKLILSLKNENYHKNKVRLQLKYSLLIYSQTLLNFNLQVINLCIKMLRELTQIRKKLIQQLEMIIITALQHISLNFKLTVAAQQIFIMYKSVEIEGQMFCTDLNVLDLLNMTHIDLQTLISSAIYLIREVIH